MSAIEQIIRDAMARGEFDDLPGRGKPIDLSAYFNTPEEMRLAYTVLNNANILPREAELLKEIAALNEQIDGKKESAEQARLLKTIERNRLELNLLLDRQKRLKAG